MSGIGPVSVVLTYSDDRVLKKDKSVAIADTNFLSEEHYTPDSGFFTRVEDLSAGSSSIRFEEPKFLPQYLSPSQEWSNTSSSAGFVKIIEHHRTFHEAHTVVVPAGHFTNCIRVETETSYKGPGEIRGTRYFKDWYAPNVGLVKTLVLGERPQFSLEEKVPIIKVLLAESGLSNHRVAIIELSAFVGPASDHDRSAKLSTADEQRINPAMSR
jgi:hypothetical protein